MLPQRKNFSNKSTYGYVALIGGSKMYSGAIRLAAMANASMRAGAGVAMLAVPDSISQYIIPHILESTIYPLSDINGEIVFNESEISALASRVKTIAFGMGIGLSTETAKVLSHLINNYKGRLIIDADGLNALARLGTDILKNAACDIILTPHNMEFSRISGLSISEILSAPIDHAKKFAQKYNCTLLLKGPSTIITDGETVYITDRGCPGMATAGSGDVLSGILAATAAYIPSTLEATALAAYVNGAAGETAQARINPVSMTASDTVASIAEVINGITSLYNKQ
jgi:NAD(P)H-hydrate epimerase